MRVFQLKNDYSATLVFPDALPPPIPMMKMGSFVASTMMNGDFGVILAWNTRPLMKTLDLWAKMR